MKLHFYTCKHKKPYIFSLHMSSTDKSNIKKINVTVYTILLSLFHISYLVTKARGYFNT